MRMRVLFVRGRLLFPEHLRDDAEHSTAVQAEPAAVEKANLNVAKVHPGTSGVQSGSVEEFANRGERVFFAFRHSHREILQFGCAVLSGHDTLEQARFQHFDQTILPVFDLFLLPFAAGFEMLPEIVDGPNEFAYSTVFCCHRTDNRRMPAIVRHHEREHGVKLFLEPIGAFAIRLVQHEDVADFHETRLHVLNVIAEAGNENDQNTVGESDDVDFILSDADRFNKYLAFAGGIEKEGHFGGGAG